MVNTGWRGPEHKLMRLVPTPPFETTLQGTQQTSRVASRLFILKPLEQLACGPPRLGLKPTIQLRRHRHVQGGDKPGQWSVGLVLMRAE